MCTFPKSKFNFRKTNWKKLNNFLTDKNLNTQNIDSEQKIDDSIQQLTKSIKNAIKISTPACENKVRDPPLPKFILDKITERNKLKSKHHKKPDITIKKRMNFLKREIETEINLDATLGKKHLQN